MVQSYKNLKKELQNNIEASTTLDEISQTIFSNQWMRIFLIGNLKANKIYLQVEVSPKVEFQSTSSNYENDIEKSKYLKEYLSNQIKSLEHLLQLTNIGFLLEFIIEEGIWFGMKILENEPSEELCKLISPPY